MNNITCCTLICITICFISNIELWSMNLKQQIVMLVLQDWIHTSKRNMYCKILFVLGTNFVKEAMAKSRGFILVAFFENKCNFILQPLQQTQQLSSKSVMKRYTRSSSIILCVICINLHMSYIQT